ncbi:Uncharacterised protein [Pasteurella multocida]|uniref:Lipoprotein n=1 Tax=Pasteurella dagmatis ATCC 43325 TaxID=667128 RepID=C9PRJ0_9PAST|nr:hypothetical protein [Pasteurella dagmatis]EEX49811.1 hypothetical protein HMPREF0621_1614 [Pasteurella dagmatis ATCC 43325]SNV62522.1 Uncharacterised protein [Pasteurella dagmatis]VEI57463.1 Uncharacterised protein [Pasteurella multocida]
MIKIHSNIVLMILIFLITGCYPCKFLDRNFNQSVADTKRYKTSLICEKEQQKVAKEILKGKYTEDIDIYIIDKCIISDGEYKIISDSKFK